MKPKQEAKDIAQEMLYGQKKDLVLPSGFKVTIREQNGQDDEILSNAALSKDLSNIDMFVSGLIVDTDLPFVKGGKITSKDIDKMSLRDKYYIVFCSRMHNIGDKVKIEYDWGKDDGGKAIYEADLNDHIWDFHNEFPEESSSEYKDTYIKPHNTNPYETLEFTLDSGKELRCSYLCGQVEKTLLKLRIDQQTINSELKARGLELKVNEKWMKVDNFLPFSKRDMIQLRTVVNTIDPPLEVNTELVNPLDNRVVLYPVIASQDFFYPEEI